MGTSRALTRLITAFENRSVDPFRAVECRERPALLFEKGLKSPLACNETITIRHDVVRALFPGLPSDLRGSPYLASEEELIAAGLGPYLKRCLTTLEYRNLWAMYFSVSS